MSKNKLPTPQEAANPPSVAAHNLAPTENPDIQYDMSKPVFMVSKTKAGKVEIPTYEEIPKVTGRFKNNEHPGQALCIPFRKGWKGPIRYFVLEEGRTITIPVTLCDTLNNECAYEEKKWVTNDGHEISRPVQVIGGRALHPTLQKEVKSRRNRFQFIVDHKLSYTPKIREVI